MEEKKMKKQKIVALVLSLVLVASLMLLGACAPKATEEAPEEAPEEATEEATEETVDLADHEVYTYLDDTAFGGVTAPTLADRSEIEKNLPVEQKSDVVIGWACPTMGSSYFAGIKIGAEAQAAKYGYTLKFLVAGDFDGTKMSADIESLVTQGVDILVVDPCDTQGNLIDVERAIEAGIPVLTTGVPFDQSAPVITTVVSNNYEGGFITAMYAAQYYDEPIEMILIPGILGHPVSNSRMNGFLAGWVYGKQTQNGTAKEYREDAMLEGYSYYKELVNTGKIDMSKYDAMVGGAANGGFNEVDGMTAAEDLLTANPNTSLIFAENDHMGIGASKVLEQRSLTDQIKIVCAADGDAKAIEMVRDGQLLTSGYNNPVAIAKRCIDIVNMIFEQGFDANNLPIITQLPVICITADNYMDVYEEGSDYAKELEIPVQSITEINASK